MKALVYQGPESLAYQDVADPEPGSGDILIRIDSVGICGSDMHAYLGHDERRPAPLILGHEAAGIITGGARDGTRVTVNPLVACGSCPACQSGRDNLCPSRQIISMPPREGAFAEWLVMPENNLVEVPSHISLEAASMVEPIACGWHAVRLGREALVEDQVASTLIIGGGPIGVGAAFCCKAQGTGDITLVEPNAIRRRYIERVCGFRCLEPGNLPQNRFHDLVVDAVGFEATRAQASALARPGGVIVHIGLGTATGGLDIRRMTLQEITFIGTYTYTDKDFRDTAEAMFDGRLGDLNWTESRPLSGGSNAFADIRRGLTEAPKTILKPQET